MKSRKPVRVFGMTREEFIVYYSLLSEEKQALLENLVLKFERSA